MWKVCFEACDQETAVDDHVQRELIPWDWCKDCSCSIAHLVQSFQRYAFIWYALISK